MNKLIIAALLTLAATAAQARAVMYLPNEGGGKIFLTDETCKIGSKVIDGLKRAYTYISSGVTTEGCWRYETDIEMVKVIWATAGAPIRLYSLDQFTLIEKQPTASRSSL